jgi:prolyl 4-hydroxylase
MKTEFEQRWKNWIQNNLSAGCSKESISKILLDEGYTAEAIERELNPQSHIPDLLLRNPLSVSQATLQTSPFNPQWQNWIQSNLDAGCDKDGIFKILLDEGFDYQAIKHHMAYEPSVAAVLLQNPLKTAQQNKIEQEQDQQVSTASVADFLYLPNAKRFNSSSVELYTVEDFLSEQECTQLISLIEQRMQPSTLSSAQSDAQFRTSSTCHLGTMDSPLVKKIDQQICNYLGIDVSYSEVIQGQHYQVGQQFKAHTDYFESHEMSTHGGQRGQRTYTFMIYLNDVEQGGETVFANLGTSFKPQRGMAVIWNNLNPEGIENYQTLHQALPVIQGQKVIITKWFRRNSTQVPSPSMWTKEANEYVPAYTKTGFVKQRFPEQLFKQIVSFYQSNNSKSEEEFVPGDFIYNAQKSGKSSSLIELPEQLKQLIHDTMKPLMEEWCGQLLEPTYVYGIRVYHNNAMLKSHRDRLETHIISAIINVDQQVSQDWPLVIEDNFYRQHHLLLKPGDMVFYEGARLTHGRPIALKGHSFANIFCHFKPVNYVPKMLT